MVNLTFYRLDVPYLIISDNSEAQHSSISIFHFPSAGRSFMLEFLFWSFKVIWFGAFQIACGLFGHLLFGFRFPGEISFSLILRVDQLISLILDHDPICWMLWYHDGFFQTTAGVRSDRGHLIFLNFLSSFWSIRQILFTSVPLYYFDLKSDWLPLFPFAFGSPPEDLLFRYLLFVPIEYHGNSNFSRWNVSQMHTSAFVQSTDFPDPGPIQRWLEDGGVIW